jgi:hypothetical protein
MTNGRFQQVLPVTWWIYVRIACIKENPGLVKSTATIWIKFRIKLQKKAIIKVLLREQSAIISTGLFSK